MKIERKKEKISHYTIEIQPYIVRIRNRENIINEWDVKINSKYNPYMLLLNLKALRMNTDSIPNYEVIAYLKPKDGPKVEIRKAYGKDRNDLDHKILNIITRDWQGLYLPLENF